jgi:hypothetical protein
VTGTFFASLFVATWWRDNLASDEWKRRVESRGTLPHRLPTTWLCVGLLALICLILRHTYKIWEDQAKELVAFRARPVPEYCD